MLMFKIKIYNLYGSIAREKKADSVIYIKQYSDIKI